MDKNDLMNLLKSRNWYQSIGIDENTYIEGRRQSRERLALMDWPKDFKGKSVLDIGCNLGYFCLEAKERNAGRVIGIDYRQSYLKAAESISQYKNLEIEYLNIDLYQNDFLQLPKFDYVFVFSVLHRARNVKNAIKRVGGKTKHCLIFEGLISSKQPNDLYLETGNKKRHHNFVSIPNICLLEQLLKNEGAFKKVNMVNKSLPTKNDINPRFIVKAYK